MSFLPQTLGKYVYFNSLYDIDPSYAARAKAYVTFNGSKNGSAIKEFDDKNHDITSAIKNAVKQLEAIAASEAAKEQAAIANYTTKIQQALNNPKIPKQIKTILSEQLNKIQSYKYEGSDKSQIKLIQQINIVRQGIERYQRRLNELNVLNENNLKRGDKINIYNRVEHRLLPNVQTYIINQGKRGNKNTTNINKDQLLHAHLQEAISKVITNIPADIMPLIEAAFFVDFNYWLEDICNKHYPDININELESQITNYLKQQNNELERTHMWDMVYENGQQLQDLEKDLQQFFHSDIISNAEYQELKRIQQKAKENEKQTEFTFNKKTYTRTQLNKIIKSYESNVKNKIGDNFVFAITGNTAHGNFYEIINEILKSAINVRGNVGADLIVPLCTLKVSHNDQAAESILMQLSKDLGDVLTEDFKTRDKADMNNFNQAIKDEKKLTNQLQQKLSEAQDSLKSLDDLGQFFIEHESLKLYRGFENNSENFDEFHGRKMNILNALAKLYAAPGINNAMINSDMLITYLLNIDESTLGNNRTPLETYLSLFAGLLMFDDISIMAQDGINQALINIPSNPGLYQLHVYNLNGVYLPISIILNEIISQVESIINNLSIDASKTAAAKIEQTIGSYKSPVTPDTWSEVASATINSTKIQIYFLSGFTDYISSLASAFGA